MPARDSVVEVAGLITEALPNFRYRIMLRNGRTAVAWLGSHLRLKFIEILPGDKVLVEFSPFDMSRGRIVARVD